MREPAGMPVDPLAPLRSSTWWGEARRKSIHLTAVLLPLGMLFEWLPWPRGRVAWIVFLATLTAVAVTVDAWRLQDRRVRGMFQRFFGEMLREHEGFNLLGSTFLLVAAMIAVAGFPRVVAAAAIGFTVLGDGFAGLVGRGWGRTRVFDKSLEGALAGLVACVGWAVCLAAWHRLPLAVGIAGALVAVLVELLPIPLDDNLGITLASALTMRLCGATA